MMEYTRLIVFEDISPTEEERLEALRDVAHGDENLGRVPAPAGLRARTLETHPELRGEVDYFEILYDPITFQVLAAFPGDVSPPERFIDEPIRQSISEERSGIDAIVLPPVKDVAVTAGHSLESDGVVTENKIGKTADCVGHYSLNTVVAAFSTGVLLGWLISRFGVSQIIYKRKSKGKEKKQAMNNRGEISGSGI